MEEIFVPLWTVQCWVMSHESSLKATTFVAFCDVFMSIHVHISPCSTVPGLKFYHSQGESCRFARQGQTKSKRKTLFSKSNIILGISHIHWCNIHWISCHSQVTSKSWKLQLAAFGRFEVNVNLAGLGFSLLAPTSCALVATVKTGFSGSCPHSRTVMNLRSFWDRCFPWSSGRDGKRACLACVPPSPSALFLHVTISDFCFGPCQSSLISLSYWWNDSLTVKWLLKNDTLGVFWRTGRRERDLVKKWRCWLVSVEVKSSGNQQNEWRMQLVHAGLFFLRQFCDMQKESGAGIRCFSCVKATKTWKIMKADQLPNLGPAQGGAVLLRRQNTWKLPPTRRRWDSRAYSAGGCIKAKISIESIGERASRMTWWWVRMGDA